MSRAFTRRKVVPLIIEMLSLSPTKQSDKKRKVLIDSQFTPTLMYPGTLTTIVAAFDIDSVFLGFLWS